VGCENASFQVPKVLAVGQTSGSGGWVKKNVSITMRGDGLSIAFGNPKKKMANSTCLAREASLKLDLCMVFPRGGKTFGAMNVWLSRD